MKTKLLMIPAILLWTFSVFGVFTDVTEEALGYAPTAMPGNNSVGWVDINSDGLIDLWVGPYHFFLNNGDGTFTQRPTDDFTTIGTYGGHSRGSFADADNDGDVDFVLASHQHTTDTYDQYCYYFENLGAPDYQFSGEIIYTYPLNVKGGQPMFVDGDGDGDAEIYLAMFGNWSPTYAIGLDRYFDQDTNGNWQNVVADQIPQLMDIGFRRPSRGVNCCDYDNDFDMDIFVPVYGISYAESWYNMLWRNDGTGVFQDYADPAGVQIEPHGRYGIGLASGACFGDFNNDGWFDLITANIHGWAALYDNNHDGTFTNVTQNSGLFTSGPEKQWHNATWMEWDNDGDEDLILTQWYGNEGYTGYLFRNNAPEQPESFEIVTAEMGIDANTVLKDVGGTAAGDFDQDGDLDLLMYSHSTGFIGVYLYRNDLSGEEQNHHWLTVKPVGDGINVNTTAIGAQVRVFYPDGTASAVKQIETATSDETCHQQIAHFGLGGHDQIQQVMIRWLDGTREYWLMDDIEEVDQQVTLEYGTGSTNSAFHYVDGLFTGDSDGTLEAPFQTISAAIEASASDDVIRVEPGFYFENLDFAGKELKIHAPGPRNSTMLSPSPGTPAVRVVDCPGESELSGLMIMGGNSDTGGGIYCESSTLYLDRMEIVSNGTSGTGAGIHARWSAVFMQNSRLQWNSADQDGGAIFAFQSDLSISNCLFSENQSDTSGASIALDEGTLHMRYSTLAENGQGNNTSLWFNGAVAQITSCILWNQSQNEISSAGSATVNVVHSCVKGGMNGPGNFADNPRFWDTLNDDYRLTPFSPCLGAGDASMTPPTDIDGNPRPMPAGSVADVGCFEHERDFAAMSRLHVAPGGSDTTGDGTADSPWGTVQYALDQAIGTDSVLVMPGTYTENIVMPGVPVTLGSMYMITGNKAMIEQTVLDGGTAGSVITIDNWQDEDTKITGFTLAHGAAGDGGGIRVQGANPTLERLIIHDCWAGNNGGGIHLSGASPRIDHVILHGNIAENQGGGIVMMNAAPILTGCTIAGNTAGGGGGMTSANSAGTLVNTIIRDNSPGAINLLNGEIFVHYSNIEGGWEGDGNIDADPLFVDPTDGDYHLQESSVCINAGIAFLQNDGVTLIDLAYWQYVGTAPDMGAWEFGALDNGSEELAPAMPTLSQNRPNPFNPVTTIDFRLPEPSRVTLAVFNIRGQLVRTLVNETRDSGLHSVTWDGTGGSGHALGSGVYFYRLQTGDGNGITRRMILLK